MTDVWFAVELSDTQFMDEVEVNADIAKLPDLRGYGNTHQPPPGHGLR